MSPTENNLVTIQHHMPRHPGEVLPTYELGVKQTDLGPGCGS